jgi:hypothetical protein
MEVLLIAACMAWRPTQRAQLRQRLARPAGA